MAITVAAVALIMAAVAGTFAAVETREAGKFQAKVLKNRAKQEEIAARDRELERRRKSNKILSAQIASRGGGGTDFSGSLQSLALSDAAISGLDLLSSRAIAENRISNTLNQAKRARRSGNLQALSQVFSTASSTITSAQDL